MKYCKKINLNIGGKVDPHKTRILEKHVLSKHGKFHNVDDYSVIRRYIPRNEVQQFKDALPQELLPHIIVITLTEIALLAPHIHTKDKCVINFYQDVDGEITSFYEGPIEINHDWTQDSGNAYYNVKVEPLKKVEEFSAEDGDVWILNTMQPHSVEEPKDKRTSIDRYKPLKDRKRIIIQAYCDLPYEDALKYFE